MFNINDLLIGYKITNIKRTLDLIMIDFVNDQKQSLFLHIQTFFRVINSNELIMSSGDLYRSKEDNDEEIFDWTQPGSTVFDNCIKKSLIVLIGKYVKEVVISNFDMRIILSDDTFIEVLVDTVESEEKYRIFDNEKVYLEIYS